MRARVSFLLALLVAGAAAGDPAPDPERERDATRAERDFTHAIGVLGYVHGAALLQSAIAEYRQTAGIGADLSARRGQLAHLMGGALASHETGSLALPEPDVLLSSAWLDLGAEPFVLWIPPTEGAWYSVQVLDARGDVAGVLSSRTIGGVGGWYRIAHAAFAGERPPGLMEDELRVPTAVARLLIRIAATPETQAKVHARLQARLLLLPESVYARSPKAAEYAKPPVQAGAPALRALPEMRGTSEAFRVINHRLRQLEPRSGEAALLALFDRAGFGPAAPFEPQRLPLARLDGLRAAARDAERMLREARPPPVGWTALPAPVAPGAEPLLHAAAALDGAAPTLPEEIALAITSGDADGRPLDGRRDYVIRFAKDALPPARAFWSLAAYDAESHRLLDTRGEPRSVSSLRNGLVRGPDDELVVFVSSDAPEDPARRANWLPVRNGPFLLVARLYEPLPPALDGGYALPPVEPADD